MLALQVGRFAARKRRLFNGWGEPLREILRTNDPVLLNAVEVLLQGADIVCLVLDQNMSVLEGSIGMLPRRVLVADEQEAEARDLLAQAGLAYELRP